MSFKDLALPLAMRGIRVARLHPRSKIPMEKNFQNLATTDVDKILAWDSETPGANCACIAKPDGVCFFESDVPGTMERYEKETGTSVKTFTVQSRPGRLHYYFLQTDETRECGNIIQSSKGGATGLPFGSFRQANEFVVAPGSTHPDTGLKYEIFDSSPIISAPNGFAGWLSAQRSKPPAANPETTEIGPILEGGRDNTLTSIGGKLRHAGLDYAEIEAALLRINEERCKPPMTVDDVKRIARSVSRYPKDDLSPTVLIGGVPAGQTVVASYAQANVEQAQVAIETVSAAEAEGQEVREEEFEYPYWCWNGTLYEDFAALCGENNVVPKEYMIESIKTVMGAICGHRIYPFKTPSQESRFYTVLIGPGGTGKTSAARWARDLFIGTGLLYELSQNGAYSNIGCAQGSFASSSGLIKNGFSRHSRILQFYDEATTMIEKFGITGSGDSFLDAQNQLYEAGAMPQLTTKEHKDESPLRAGQLVHNSILSCTTKEKWASSFVKTNSESSGFFQRLNVITNDSEDTVANFMDPDLTALRDSFVKKIQPLEYQNVVVMKLPEASDMLEKWYKEKRAEFREMPTDVTGRIQVLVQRNASHLAWLMAGDIVPDPDKANEPIEVVCDEDIMSRALALAEYQIGARHAHQPAPGKNDWAIVENMIKITIKRKGAMQRSKLHREIRADKYGINAFDKAITNLVQEGIVKIAQKEGETKRGRKAQIIMWVNE